LGQLAAFIELTTKKERCCAVYAIFRLGPQKRRPAPACFLCLLAPPGVRPGLRHQQIRCQAQGFSPSLCRESGSCKPVPATTSPVRGQKKRGHAQAQDPAGVRLCSRAASSIKRQASSPGYVGEPASTSRSQLPLSSCAAHLPSRAVPSSLPFRFLKTAPGAPALLMAGVNGSAQCRCDKHRKPDCIP
jgi:hypothetical protein